VILGVPFTTTPPESCRPAQRPRAYPPDEHRDGPARHSPSQTVLRPSSRRSRRCSTRPRIWLATRAGRGCTTRATCAAGSAGA